MDLVGITANQDRTCFDGGRQVRYTLGYHMQMERVVITGMGTVNALAKNTAAFARALQEGACGIGLMTCVKPREMNKPA